MQRSHSCSGSDLVWIHVRDEACRRSGVSEEAVRCDETADGGPMQVIGLPRQITRDALECWRQAREDGLDARSVATVGVPLSALYRWRKRAEADASSRSRGAPIACAGQNGRRRRRPGGRRATTTRCGASAKPASSCDAGVSTPLRVLWAAPSKPSSKTAPSSPSPPSAEKPRDAHPSGSSPHTPPRPNGHAPKPAHVGDSCALPGCVARDDRYSRPASGARVPPVPGPIFSTGLR